MELVNWGNPSEADRKMMASVLYYIFNRIDGLKEFKRGYQKLIFLAELEYYKTFGQRLTSYKFISWDYGAFSKELSIPIEDFENGGAEHKTDENVVLIVDKLLERFGGKGKNKHTLYEQMISYIHSLLIYHLVPYGQEIAFEKFPRELLDKTVENEGKELDGTQLKYEKFYIYPKADAIAARVKANLHNA